MIFDIEYQVNRLNGELHYFANIVNISMEEINNEAIKWIEFSCNSTDEEFENAEDLVKTKFFTDDPNFGMSAKIVLIGAAMGLLDFYRRDYIEEMKWPCLLMVAEKISWLRGSLEMGALNERSKKQQLSDNGRKGAQAKHQTKEALKAWALERAKSLRGSDMERSKELALQMPSHLLEASKNPQRLIYDTLRMQYQQRQASQP